MTTDIRRIRWPLALALGLMCASATAKPSFWPWGGKAPISTAEDRAKTCLELEYDISALARVMARRTPDFYDDPLTGAAIWVGTLYGAEGYALLAYTGYQRYSEATRMEQARERLHALQRIKAEQRCFENF